MLKGMLLRTDGTYEIVEYEDKLEVLQGFVGGLIDYVQISTRGIDMIINDEGKILGMDVNYNATRLYAYDIIVGDVLVVRTENGENVDLTDEDIDLIIEEIEAK